MKTFRLLLSTAIITIALGVTVMAGTLLSTNSSYEKGEAIDTIVSNIQTLVQYTDMNLKLYESTNDDSSDPWGQYDSGMQDEDYYLNNGIVVKNCVYDGYYSVDCYHFNPDLTPEAQNGTNPEDSMVYIKGEIYTGSGYNVFLHNGKILRVDHDGTIERIYPDGREIQMVAEEFGSDSELKDLLSMAMPGAMGIDYDSSWISITPCENIVFDGEKYLFMVYGHTYVLDSYTKFDARNRSNDLYPAETIDGETPVQWLTNYYKEAAEKGQSIYLDVFVIKVTGEHIDAIEKGIYAFD